MNLLRPFLLFGLFLAFLHGQTLDILASTGSVEYRGTGGSGLALCEGSAAWDLNPAGLAALQRVQGAVAFYGSQHRYHLVNERLEESLTRIFKWQRSTAGLKNLSLALPLRHELGLALFATQRITPYLYNQRRAITWSPLYNQLSSGSISAYGFGLGGKLAGGLNFGLSGFLYRGLLVSELHGENHDRDLDKWALLEQQVSGTGLNIGIQGVRGNWAAGMRFEPGTALEVRSDFSVSIDSLYASLYHQASRADWNIPQTVAVGLAYQRPAEFQLLLDIEHRQFRMPFAQLNLYEYGGLPVFRDAWGVRTGLILFKNTRRPLTRIGYAYLPQVYANSVKFQPLGEVGTIDPGASCIQHLFTLGTEWTHRSGFFQVSLEYARLVWLGELQTYITVKDDYLERRFQLYLEWGFVR